LSKQGAAESDSPAMVLIIRVDFISEVECSAAELNRYLKLLKEYLRKEN
jgi:hypothetical protein